MHDLSEYVDRPALTKLLKMFKEPFFSICPVAEALKLLNRPYDYEDRTSPFGQLHSMHCVYWKELGEEGSRKVQENCMELCGFSLSLLEKDKPTILPTSPRGWFSRWLDSQSRGSTAKK